MQPTSSHVLKVYVTLTLLSTFASSFIWGINTLFLLDAGLSITQAFAANAFFTVGQVLFEVPTGVVADTAGRRTSYLWGAATLFITTIMYYLLWQQHGPFWLWAITSVLLGLGFTFFSGATEAWLVDALKFTNFKGSLESAFAKGQIASGAAMLSGTFAGGLIAQYSNLGVPYLLRIIMLGLTFISAFALMKDVGFVSRKGKSVGKEVRLILKASLDHGLRNPPVRWVMFSGLFLWGVGIYGFYAAQPYLLELFGNSKSYVIAGIGASIVAGTQILGGFMVPHLRRLFARRTSLLMFATIASGLTLLVIGLVPNFWVVLGALAIWATMFAASVPVRQAYINDLIPSEQRATVLSSDNLIGSSGGVFMQPALGKAADVWGYATSYVISGVLQLLALPFIWLARRTKSSADKIL